MIFVSVRIDDDEIMLNRKALEFTAREDAHSFGVLRRAVQHEDQRRIRRKVPRDVNQVRTIHGTDLNARALDACAEFRWFQSWREADASSDEKSPHDCESSQRDSSVLVKTHRGSRITCRQSATSIRRVSHFRKAC